MNASQLQQVGCEDRRWQCEKKLLKNRFPARGFPQSFPAVKIAFGELIRRFWPMRRTIMDMAHWKRSIAILPPPMRLRSSQGAWLSMTDEKFGTEQLGTSLIGSFTGPFDRLQLSRAPESEAQWVGRVQNVLLAALDDQGRPCSRSWLAGLLPSSWILQRHPLMGRPLAAHVSRNYCCAGEPILGESCQQKQQHKKKKTKNKKKIGLVWTGADRPYGNRSLGALTSAVISV